MKTLDLIHILLSFQKALLRVIYLLHYKDILFPFQSFGYVEKVVLILKNREFSIFLLMLN